MGIGYEYWPGMLFFYWVRFIYHENTKDNKSLHSELACSETMVLSILSSTHNLTKVFSSV